MVCHLSYTVQSIQPDELSPELSSVSIKTSMPVYSSFEAESCEWAHLGSLDSPLFGAQTAIPSTAELDEATEAGLSMIHECSW